MIYAYDFYENGIYYKILDNTNRTVAVTLANSNYNYAADTYSGDVTIPSTVSRNGINYTVKEIGEYAFYNCSKLKSVDISSGITKIGESAFHNSSNITTIKIPSTVTCIELNAFRNCKSLVSADIPSSVVSIGYNLFSDCTSMPSEGDYTYAGTYLIEAVNKGLVNASIKQGTKFIGELAFADCEQLSSVSLPSSVVLISAYAFDNCPNLTSINLPNGLKKIDIYAFSGCKKLSTISIPSTVEEIGTNAFMFCNSFPVIDGIRYADTFLISASYGANKIKEGTRFIGNAYFNGITSINIPSSVISINREAFYNCQDLSVITIDNNNKKYDSREGCNAVIETETNTLIIGCKNTTIPNSVISIGTSAFDGVRNLSSISFPETVTTIGGGAFRDCTGLQSVNLSENATIIDNSAFSGCTGLTSLSIPSSVTTIGDRAFYGCTKLTEIINYSRVPQQVSANTFTTFGNLRVPKGCSIAYSNAAYWKNFNVVDGLTLNMDLTDGKPFEKSENFLYDQLTYTRNFTYTDWNALYVPFSMSYADWSDNFEIARLNDVHQFDDNEDGEIDRTVLEVVKMKEGSVTEPNTPYMIKAKEIGEKTITLTDATLYASDENSFDVTSWYTKFTFTGTYSTVTDMATKGHYALANGVLKQASSDAATLGAFRWYLDITDRNGNPTPLTGKKVFLSFDDGETTELKFVEANDDNNYAPVYSISGVNVGNDKASLPKGLFISKGKKFVIK